MGQYRDMGGSLSGIPIQFPRLPMIEISGETGLPELAVREGKYRFILR